MSVILPDQRAGYKLIPQSNSEDSELSEEELESLYRDGFQIITKNHVYSTNHRKRSNHSMSQSNINMTSENFDLKAKNIFPTDKDNVTYELTTMTRERKFALALSILLCFLTIIIFLMLPCEWSNCSCTKDTEESKEIWRNPFTNIEIKGAISLVENVFGNYYNLLFMASGSMFADSPIIRSDVISASGGDIILLNGLSGKQIWRKHFNNMPTEVDCSLIYNKNRNINECVMVGHGNYVALISSDEGKLIWNFPGNSAKHNRTYYQFPVVLPDLDGDDVRELAVIKDSNKLVLLSGLTGINLLNNVTNEECVEISQLKYIDWLNLGFSCKLKNDSSKPVTISLKRYLNISPTTKKNIRIPQHVSYHANENSIRGHRIIVNNEGTFCPNNCSSEVNIIDENNKTVWTHTSSDSFVMKPSTFAFNNSGMYGFVFKIWEHENEESDTKKLKVDQHDFQFTVGSIFERTVIVVFNSTLGEPLQTINMSLNRILQLYDLQKTPQPDPKFQENSLLILDVNKNGTYQLVTYYSTFEEKKNHHLDASAKNLFTLKSYIQMYDLNKEISRNSSTP